MMNLMKCKKMISFFIYLSYRQKNMNKLRYHIDISKNITRCKNCKCLKMPKYLGDILCEKCEKEYLQICNKILFNY